MSLTLHQKRVGMSWRICQPGWHVLAFSREFFCTQNDVLWYFANHLYVWKDNYININPNIKKLYRDLWRSFRLHALLLQTNVMYSLTTPDKSLVRKEEKIKFIVTHHLIKSSFFPIWVCFKYTEWLTSFSMLHSRIVYNYFHQRCKAPAACEGNSRRCTGTVLGCKLKKRWKVKKTVR